MPIQTANTIDGQVRISLTRGDIVDYVDLVLSPKEAEHLAAALITRADSARKLTDAKSGEPEIDPLYSSRRQQEEEVFKALGEYLDGELAVDYRAKLGCSDPMDGIDTCSD